MIPMRIEGRGLVSAGLRKTLNILLYSFICVQYIVLLFVIREAGQQHRLPFRTLMLPILYFAPLAIGFGFRQHIRVLSNKELLSAGVANVCYDWITCILCIVYGILLEFRWLR
jgi:hypothetical protein